MSAVGPTAILMTAMFWITVPPAAAQDVEPPPSFPTTAPGVGPAPSVNIPVPVERSLPNGLRVLYVTRTDLPVVHATLVTRGGSSDAPADAVELASFTADLLDEGAGGRGALELESEFELLGASLRVGSGWDGVSVNLSVLRPRLPEALALMSDVVVRPDFPEEEVERKREQRLTDLSRARDEARTIASNAFLTLTYGPDHPYGRLATTAATGAITRDQMVDFHSAFYRPNISTFILVGDVSADRDHGTVEQAFGSWEAGEVPIAETPEAPVIGPTRIFLIDKPGAAQSEIRIGHPGVWRGDDDYFLITVMNTILGGSFTSRLNSNLREEHGYTYGAGSGFSMRRGAGPFQASAAVVTDKTDSAVVEFFSELERIRTETAPEDEVDRARNFVALGFPRRFETTRGTASQIADLVMYDLETGWLEEYVPATLGVTSEQVLLAAARHVRPATAVVVIVGDRATVEPGLRALDLAPVEVRDVAEFVN
jgi:predicted Zn-dependent peptidase